MERKKPSSKIEMENNENKKPNQDPNKQLRGFHKNAKEKYTHCDKIFQVTFYGLFIEDPISMNIAPFWRLMIFHFNVTINETR